MAFSAINIRFLYCQEKYDFCKLALSILSSEINKTKWASRSSPMHTSLGPRCGQTCQGPKNPIWSHLYLCIRIKALEHLQRNQVNVSVFTVTHLQWPLSLTWFNFNPIMDRLSHAQKSVGLNYHVSERGHRLSTRRDTIIYLQLPIVYNIYLLVFL